MSKYHLFGDIKVLTLHTSEILESQQREQKYRKYITIIVPIRDNYLYELNQKFVLFEKLKRTITSKYDK